MTIYEKLQAIQQELKVPKDQKNTFGNYMYRSCEDILEKLKPLEAKHGVVLILSDDAVAVGDRLFIKATATLRDIKTDEQVQTSAFAMHSIEKKGMDDSQMSGTASSYARKYACNALFLLDDTKDADTDEFGKQMQAKSSGYSNGTRLEFDAVREHLDKLDDLKSVDAYGEELKKKHPSMTKAQADAISKMFNKRREEISQNESD